MVDAVINCLNMNQNRILAKQAEHSRIHPTRKTRHDVDISSIRLYMLHSLQPPNAARCSRNYQIRNTS